MLEPQASDELSSAMGNVPSRVKLGFLIASHLPVAMILFGVCIGAVRGRLGSLVYLQFLASEIVLLGIWIGLTTLKISKRVLCWLLGIALIYAFVTAPIGYLTHAYVPLVVICNLTVVAPLAVYSRFGRRIEWGRKWPSTLNHSTTQFTLKSLLALPVLFGVVLALGGAIRSLVGTEWTFVGYVATMAILAALEAWLLIWGSLGLGNLRIRLPLALAGAAMLGFIPVYFLGGRSFSHFLASAELTLSVTVISLVSLLVVRRLGYRIVPICDDVDKNRVTHEHNEHVTV